MKLGELQQRFWSLATREVQGPGAAELFHGVAPLDPEARLGIYADMFLWRQVDALREDFPKLVLVMGDEGFFQLAEKYLKVHPSVSPSIGHLGRHLAAFLRSQQIPERADLADLAALEWARSEIFDEVDSSPVSIEALAALPPEEVPGCSLVFAPALARLALSHDVVSLWQWLEEGEAACEPAPELISVAVWRKELRVFHVTLAADEGEALALAMGGAPFAEVCSAFSGREEPDREALEAIGSWFAEGWVTGVSVSASAQE